MNKTRIVARILAGAAASALLLTGGLAAPAQADTGWGSVKKVVKMDDTSTTTGVVTIQRVRDTGWGSV